MLMRPCTAQTSSRSGHAATVPDGDAVRAREWPRHWPLLLLGAALLPGTALVVLGRWMDAPAVLAWRTVCLAVCVQALPFLLLGTALSGAINAFVPASVFQRVLPRRGALAVPVAGVAGVVLPGCECASVPVARSLIGRGVTPAAAFAFLLSAPAVNPIVLTATAVAFPGRPEMVLARLVASLATACAMGWLWLWLGKEEWLRPSVRHTGHRPGHSRWAEFRAGLPARPAARGRVPGGGRDGRGHLQRRRPAVRARHLRRVGLAVGAVPGGARRAAGGVLGGGRLRRGLAVRFLAGGAADVHGGRPDGRPEADRAADGHLRAGLRGPLLQRHGGGRGGVQRAGRGILL